MLDDLANFKIEIEFVKYKPPCLQVNATRSTTRTKIISILNWKQVGPLFKLLPTKGQLISKGLDFFQQNERNIFASGLGQELTFSSSFFGRNEDTKIFFRD